MRVFIAFSLLLTVLTVQAAACSCDIRSHERDLREAHAVFVGRVLQIGANETGDEETRRFAPFKVTFEVEKGWKGKKGEVAVVTDNNGPPCGGFRFEKGERYLIYAFGKELETATACSRSRPLNRADQDRQKEMDQLGSVWFRFWARVWRF